VARPKIELHEHEANRDHCWHGIWEIVLPGKADLRLILWPSSIMITVGWCSTAAGIMTTISSIAINCLLYIGIALSLRRCFQWLRSA
jgi:hypothetical protein